MSDLISRSALIEDIDKQVEELQQDGRKDEARGITLEFVEAFKKIINNQPTAYDVENIVDLLRFDCYQIGLDESMTEILVEDVRKGWSK